MVSFRSASGSRGEERKASGLLGPYFKHGAGSKETDIELHEEVHLAQYYRHRIRLGPAEGEADWRKTADCRGQQDDSRLYGGEVALNSTSLVSRSQSNPSCNPNEY